MERQEGPRRVVLDVDTGVDDALALLYAAASPALELCGVTTVAGNVPVEVAARNSAAVLAHAGAGHVPVAVGASRTTAGGGPRTGPTNHGTDGLGGVALPPGPEPSALGVRAVVDEVASAGAYTLVALAPMTNVAELAPSAAEVVLLGGALGGELAAGEPPEFNAAHDVPATLRALASGRPTKLYVIDVFEQVSVRVEDVARLRSSDRPAARLAGDLLAVRRSRLIGDAGALVLLTHAHLFRVEQRRVGIVGSSLTEAPDGRLLDVVVGVDAPAVARAYVDALLA